MQFEIPAEMLQGMMGGGGMGGGGRGRKPTAWPKTESSEIAPEFEWLVNTEWKGKTAKYLFLRDGFIESPLKECEPEGQCLWAANNGNILINTPTLRVVKFSVEGLDKVDGKKLENKDPTELQKLVFVSEKPSKSGKRSRLEFSRLATADDGEVATTRDLYEILGLEEDAEQKSIKSAFRRLSVQNHPDKGGDPKVFNEIREAYEVLSDPDMRRYYAMGGMQLVKNIESSWKEVEGQKTQLDLQLNKVPKNHPQYRAYKAQIEEQKMQFERATAKPEIEKKLRNEDIEVFVPIPVQELYTGVPQKAYDFRRSVICRGCRAEPTSEKCKDCGRCPPEKIQVPQYGMTPFGRQVVGMREKEQESLERCREVSMPIANLKVSRGAKEGSTLKTVYDIGHQTPGKIPGRVVLKVQRGDTDDKYAIAESDLFTVLHISLEQALFGFSASWTHLGGEKVTVSRNGVTSPGEVVRLRKKGLVEAGSQGDLYVRLAVDMPSVAEGTKSLTLQAPATIVEPRLEREDPVELRNGAAWRRWTARETATSAGSSKAKEEL